MGKTMRAIGLMSGTSMDGIDVALIDTDGESRVERGPAQTFPYDPRFKASLRGGHRRCARRLRPRKQAGRSGRG